MDREQTTLTHLHDALARVAEHHEQVDAAHAAAVADAVDAAGQLADRLVAEQDTDSD